MIGKNDVLLKFESANGVHNVRVIMGRQTRIVNFNRPNSAFEFMKRMDCYCKLKTAKQLNLIDDTEDDIM